MSTILAAERSLYEDVWSSVSSYGDHAPGEHYLPIFLQIVGEQRGTVLDAGTGSGKGALALQQSGFIVSACDVTDAGLVEEAQRLEFRLACLWRDLTHLMKSGGIRPVWPYDWVYCTDVLEHIPPQFTMLAVEQMLRVSRYGLFLTVSLVPDSFGVWAGKSLHQTVQPFGWWKDSLGEIGIVTDARDLINAAAFMVTPR